jgi:RNA polymerase sigma factor (sigma-70 family)
VSKDADTSFAEFVHGRSAHLFKLALLLTGQNRAEAEDLLQIALERAYRRRASLSRGRSPEAYVRRVLVNASIDRWRALGRRAERPLDAVEAGPPAADLTGQVADRDLLMRSLAVLPPRQRAVLVLRYWEDRSEAEIAGLLERPGHISGDLSVNQVSAAAKRGTISTSPAAWRALLDL